MSHSEVQMPLSSPIQKANRLKEESQKLSNHPDSVTMNSHSNQEWNGKVW